ncbi:MHS family MFS transporter [Agromyces intestinalis]|uniref:MHS family MFS transporter n=1 Tax=Agromyces intestinalis TaxID=2592652 RepID=A0A5C1YFE1_9MICO|nr:MFS transporter [Agromyces intestinalis]QEO14906.1 MHS family MFS transporter [Agromyces intestinalis]
MNGANRAPARRALVGATAGTVLEWYDFFLYGTAAALVFPTLFFPDEDPLTGVLLSFAVYATGFVARPLGGLLSGALGDRIGRRRTLLGTLLVMGIASALIGLQPTHSQIGAAAPTLLVVLRFIQGAATGGEWSGAVLLALEHSRVRPGFRGAFVTSGVYVGLILGNLAFVVLVATLDEQALLSWGWRVPFLASLVLVAIGLVLRRRVGESPEFLDVVARHERVHRPIAVVLRRPRNVLAILLIRGGQNATFYVVTVFCLSYAATTGMPRWVTLTALLVGATLAAVLCPLWGAVGDRIGARQLTAWALAGLGLLAVPLFVVLDTGNAALVVGFVALLIGIVNSAADGMQPAWFTAMFPANIRYSGISIGREAGGILGGALAPIAATAMLAATGHWWPVAAMMIAGAALGIVGTAVARPVRTSPLAQPNSEGAGGRDRLGGVASSRLIARAEASKPSDQPSLGTTSSATAISPVVSGASQMPK